MPEQAFYVYLKFDLNGTPRYVGKGRDSRAWDHERLGSHNHQLQGLINRARRLGRELPTVIVAASLSETQAFSYEMGWIRALGRIDVGTGLLFNHTDGGDGPSGLVHTDEAKARMRQLKLGKPLSEEHKAKLLVVARKPRSEGFKAKLRAARLGVRPTDEIRAKLSASHQGKIPSEATKIKMSEAQIARWARQRAVKEKHHAA